MLLIADRGFYGFDLWRQAAATGADLLWRVKNSAVLPEAGQLADGSYLSRVYAARDKNRHADPITVRVVEYTLDALVAVDGTTFDLPDTAANAGFFGRPGSARGAGKGAFPQVRVAALGECGTHAIFAAAPGPLAVHETELARRLLARLATGGKTLRPSPRRPSAGTPRRTTPAAARAPAWPAPA